MATSTAMYQVQTPMEMESMSTGFISQGYVIANRTPTSITLFKRKEFSIPWLVIGFFLCLIPLLIYLIVYATETDKMVVINLGVPGQAVAPSPVSGYGQPQMSGPPTGAPRSPDGNYWWDGYRWQPVQSTPYGTPPSSPYTPGSSPYSQPYGGGSTTYSGPNVPYPGASGPYQYPNDTQTH
jgi:hypothetical protein